VIPEWAHLHPTLLPAKAVAGKVERVKVANDKEELRIDGVALHVSHAGHAAFLAKHVARLKPAAAAAPEGDKPPGGTIPSPAGHVEADHEHDAEHAGDAR